MDGELSEDVQLGRMGGGCAVADLEIFQMGERNYIHGITPQMLIYNLMKMKYVSLYWKVEKITLDSKIYEKKNEERKGDFFFY